MGTRTMYYCDRCDKQKIQPVRLRVLNSSMPKAGFKDNVSVEDCSEEVHLCNGCIQEKMQEWVDDLGYEETQSLKVWMGR